MTPGTRPYNEAALLRILNTEKWHLETVRGAFNRIITLLQNDERPVAVEVRGLLKGRVWLHSCPTPWRSKQAGREASQWTDRHAHLDLVGKTEV